VTESSGFPQNEAEALAMFYVQNVVFQKQPAATWTPEALMKAYREAYLQFNAANKQLKQFGQ